MSRASGSAAIHEHHVISLALQHVVLRDRLNILNMAGSELLLRRLQLHESAVAESLDNPSYEGSRHFLGTSERRGGALVARVLSRYVATELGREAAILNQRETQGP